MQSDLTSVSKELILFNYVICTLLSTTSTILQERSLSQGLFVFNVCLVIGKDKDDLVLCVKTGAWAHFCLTILIAWEVVQAKARQL